MWGRWGNGWVWRLDGDEFGNFLLLWLVCFYLCWIVYDSVVKDGELASFWAKMEVNVGFFGGFIWHVIVCEDFIWVLANLWDMSCLWMRKDGKLVANFEILVLFTLFDYLWEFSLAVKCSIWPLTKIWCKFVEVKVCIWNWTLFFGREIFFNFDFFTFALIYELKKEQLLWNMLKNCNLYVSAHFIHVIYQ